MRKEKKTTSAHVVPLRYYGASCCVCKKRKTGWYETLHLADKAFTFRGKIIFFRKAKIHICEECLKKKMIVIDTSRESPAEPATKGSYGYLIKEGGK